MVQVSQEGAEGEGEKVCSLEGEAAVAEEGGQRPAEKVSLCKCTMQSQLLHLHHHATACAQENALDENSIDFEGDCMRLQEKGQSAGSSGSEARAQEGCQGEEADASWI